MEHLHPNTYIKILVAIFVSWFSSLEAQRISNCPASPHPINVRQADGTTITIVVKGSMLRSWTETTDGYTIVKRNGNYEYAIKSNGKLVASGIQAQNAQARKSADVDFLKKQQKSLKPDFPLPDNDQSFPPTYNTQFQLQASAATAGNRKVLLLLIKYPNLSITNTITDFNNLMNQPNYRGTGSFKDFFYNSSFGQMNISTDVYGWYTASKDYQYYGYINGFLPAVELVREAVDAAEASGVDFSQYDNDHDGAVDGIMVVHAGPGAEEGLEQYIWSHAWGLSVLGKQVTYDGVYIDNYAIQPERRVFLNDMVGIGVFCHEYGHVLGLPDLYDVDYSSSGVGDWSVMGTGGWLGDEKSPANFCAWSKSELGWVKPTELNANGSYSLNPASFSDQVFRINTQLPNEYFLLENRQKEGLDRALPGSGLAIWHINTNQTSNADEQFKLLDLEEADGQNYLDFGFNRGDGGDLFPGTSGNTSFTDFTNPNSRTYSGNQTNVNIYNIFINESGVAHFAFQTPVTTFYRDADGDGYGDPRITVNARTAPDGYVTDHTDCDDSNPSVHPGATESCDNKDNNCNGQVDEGCYTNNLPSVRITDTNVKEGNGGNRNVTFKLSLNKTSKQSVKVQYQTLNNTAVANKDFNPESGTITFPAGSKEQTLTIEILNDKINEANETFNVMLSGAVNATIADAKGICTILDNDPYPKLRIHNTSVYENSEKVAVQLELHEESGQEIKVKYHTQDESAKAPYDYVASKGIVTFKPGETEQFIYITIKRDHEKEGKEKFKVVLTEEKNVTVSGRRYGVVTILKTKKHDASFVYEVKGEKDKVQPQKLSAIVTPNPATSYFILNTISASDESVMVRVTDMAGRVIETKVGVAANSSIQFGHYYRPGIYYIEVIQNNKKETLKVMKLSN